MLRVVVRLLPHLSIGFAVILYLLLWYVAGVPFILEIAVVAYDCGSTTVVLSFDILCMCAGVGFVIFGKAIVLCRTAFLLTWSYALHGRSIATTCRTHSSSDLSCFWWFVGFCGDDISISIVGQCLCCQYYCLDTSRKLQSPSC